MDAALREALLGALNLESLPALQPLSGGCISQAARLSLPRGPVFLKWNAELAPGAFQREAEALAALRASGTRLRIPEVIAVGEGFLVCELLQPGPPIADFDAELGRGLAELHRCRGPAFGFEHDNFCGATPQPNGWMDDWIAFYGARRLGFQIELARRTRGVPREASRACDRLLEALPSLLDGGEAPALIHGDLWSGNLHRDARGRPALIDPAAYYANREAELGMMRLFGGFSERVYQSYDEAWPLSPGWRARLPLYTLYHVLNHYNLFGGHYGAQAWAIVRRYV